MPVDKKRSIRQYETHCTGLITKAEKFVKKTILKSALHGYFDTQKSGLLFLQLKYNNELQGNFKIDLAFPAARTIKIYILHV